MKIHARRNIEGMRDISYYDTALHINHDTAQMGYSRGCGDVATWRVDRLLPLDTCCKRVAGVPRAMLIHEDPDYT